MLDQITWGQFIVTMIVTVAAYYGFVAVAYYGKEVKQWVRARATPDRKAAAEDSEQGQRVDMEGLEQVVADLRGILEAGKGAGRQILLEQLSARLANYAGLRHPAFRVAITNFIVKHATELCSVTYTTAELEARWRELERQGP